MFLYTDEEINTDIQKKGLTPEDYTLINDISKYNEELLDFDRHIYLKNLSKNSVICNNNVIVILDYLKSQGYDLNLFFNKYYTLHSENFFYDYSKWTSFEDYIELYNRIFDFIGKYNPRLLSIYGKIGGEAEKTFINLLEMMSGLVSVITAYELIPMFNKNYDYDIAMQFISKEKIDTDHYKLTMTSKYFANFYDNVPFWNIFWLEGIMSSLPRRRKFNYARIEIPYYGLDLIRILKVDYGYLKLIVEEKEDGVYINGEKYAEKVVLKKETPLDFKPTFTNRIFNWFKNINQKKIEIAEIKSRQIYATQSVKISQIPADQVTQMIKNREARICYEIINDFIDEKEGIVVKKGEMYNLPYTRFDIYLEFKKTKKKPELLKKTRDLDNLKIYLAKLRNQVLELEEANKTARREALEAQIARRDLEELNRTLEQKVQIRTIELEKAKNEIEKASQQKQNLFINLTHETKTPLTLIKNYLDHYINENGTNADLEIIKQNIDKLCRDITNFFDLNKLERNQIFYNHDQIIHLSFLLENKITLFRVLARKKMIEIKAQIENPVYLKADPFAIDRIINNIMDNAIKYTPFDGKILVRLYTLQEDVHLWFEDTGGGISEEHLKKIFEPYYQIIHQKRNIQGIGMGLNIVKRIIDGLNGKIKIESKINTGTKVIITLKSHQLVQGEVVLENQSYSQPINTVSPIKLPEPVFQKNRMTIFLVEDNLDMLFYLIHHLNTIYNVFYAQNGKEALEKIAIVPKPKIIISDIMMDIMDGFQFYDELNKNQEFHSIPFIFLTAKNSAKDRLEGLKKGAVEYVAKPFEFNELLARIESLIKVQSALKDETLSQLGVKVYNFLNRIELTQQIPQEEQEKNILMKLYHEYGISKRQIEIISLMKNGLERKEISAQLGVSVNTVKTQINRIYEKCQVSNKLELLNIFREGFRPYTN